MDWNQILAGLINTTVVLIVVQLIKVYYPVLREKLGFFLPFLTMLIGPTVAMAQNVLSAWLGIAIDLSPITGAWTGAAAVAVHQVYHQIEKGNA